MGGSQVRELFLLRCRGEIRYIKQGVGLEITNSVKKPGKDKKVKNKGEINE